jgi:hypothetical protein
MYEGEWFNDQ